MMQPYPNDVRSRTETQNTDEIKMSITEIWAVLMFSQFCDLPWQQQQEDESQKEGQRDSLFLLNIFSYWVVEKEELRAYCEQ